MLVLSRKPGQRINIGANIVVEVRKIEGSKVVLAFEAGEEVLILRSELLEREQQRDADAAV